MSVDDETDRLLEAIERRRADGTLAEAVSTARKAQRNNPPSEGKSFGQQLRTETGKAVANLIPFYPSYQAARMAEDEGVDTGVVGRAATGAAKGASFGLLGTLGAMGEGVENFIGGGDDERSFGERRADANETVNNQSNLGGEIIGSLIGGPRAAFNAAEEGVKNIPALAKLLKQKGLLGMGTRAGVSGGLVGAETFAYSLAEGNDLGEAGYHAMFGAGLGAIGQPTAEGVIGLFRALQPTVGAGTSRKVAQNIVDALEAKYGKEFVDTMMVENQLNVDAIAARMAAGTGNETLVEIFPQSLSATVNALSRDPRIGVTKAAKPLLTYFGNMQQAALPQFREVIGEAIGRAQVRNWDEIQRAAKQKRAELVPEYEAALKNVARTPSGKAVPVKVRDLRQAVNGAFRNAKFPAELAVRDALLRQLPPETRNRRANTVTPNQLLTFRKILDDVIYNQKFPSAGEFDASSIDKGMLRDYVVPARAKIKDILYANVPDLKKLDQAYSDEIALRHAYEAGADAFKGTGGGATAKYETFMYSTDRSPAEVASFIEGVKSELMEGLMKRSSPTALQNFVKNNSAKFDLVEQVVGRDARQALEQQIDRYALVNQITRGVDDNAPSIYTGKDASTPAVADLLLMGGALGNQLSTAIGAGAARRQLAGLGKRGVGAKAEAETLADVLTQPADTAARMVNEELTRNLPALLRGNPAFAPVASGG
jgi:hypothetical protein